MWDAVSMMEPVTLEPGGWGGRRAAGGAAGVVGENEDVVCNAVQCRAMPCNAVQCREPDGAPLFTAWQKEGRGCRDAWP